MKNKNIETATYELINEIMILLEQDEVSMGLFLDSTEAFDCLEHRKLLEVLDKCGIRSN